MENQRAHLSLRTLLFSTLPCLVISHNAAAGGFQLFEQNAASIGSYHSGGAAIAEDASTAFFNPAGLTRLHKPQVTLSGTNIFTHGEFSGRATTTTIIHTQFGTLETAYPENGKTTTNGAAVVPALQLAYPLNQKTVFGLDISVPFGLATDWDKDSLVRYAATKSSIQTLNVSPNLAYQIDSHWSIGAGPDIQQLKGTFNLIASVSGDQRIDTNATNEVEGFGYGWHAGILYQVDTDTRFGLSYRSQVHHDAHGPSKFRGNLANDNIVRNVANDNTSRVRVTLPSTTTLSAFHQLSDQWDVMASMYYTQWSVIDKLELTGVTSLGLSDTTVLNPTHYHDTMSYDIGFNYRPIGKWQLSFGLGYDQTPVRNQFRDIRLPDGNRIAVSTGVRYNFSKDVTLDAGYAHLFIKSGHMNHNDNFDCDAGGPSIVTANLQGKTRGSADLIGLQVTWSM